MSDSLNEPLAGVTVHAKGQRTGTTTGPDGSFTLAIDGSVKTLVISSVGYETKEVPIGSSDVLSVTLKPGAAGNLGEVVEIGRAHV